MSDALDVITFTSDDLPTLRKLESVGISMKESRQSHRRIAGDFLAGFCQDLATEIEDKTR